MKMLKGFLIVLVGLSIVVTMFSLLMPSRVMSVRTISVNAPADSLTLMIKDFSRWKEWHPLFKNDIVLSTPSSGKRAYAELYEAKKTRFEIVEEDTASVRVALKRAGEAAVINDIVISIFEDQPGIQVEWIASSDVKWWPWEKFAGIFFDEVTGPSLDLILQSLKARAEENSTR